VHRIVIVAVVGVLVAVAAAEVAATASHAARDARTAAGLMRCNTAALDRYDVADLAQALDPTAPCAGIAKRLQAETGAGAAAVAPVPPGQ
jgi:hypothetical protein